MEDSVSLYLKNLFDFNKEIPKLLKCNDLEEGKKIVNELVKINKTALYNYVNKNKNKIKKEIFDYIENLIGNEYEKY